MKTMNAFQNAARAASSFCAEMNIALLLDNSLLLSIFILLELLAPQTVRSLTNRFSVFHFSVF